MLIADAHSLVEFSYVLRTVLRDLSWLDLVDEGFHVWVLCKQTAVCLSQVPVLISDCSLDGVGKMTDAVLVEAPQLLVNHCGESFIRIYIMMRNQSDICSCFEQ